MANETQTFTLGDLDDQHPIGDQACDECWSGYPKPCGCGGLVHATFGDEDYDGYWLYTKCDQCGERE